ncbi:MAG: hypothetical protein ACLP6G_20160 [Terriglobales bacterium]
MKIAKLAVVCFPVIFGLACGGGGMGTQAGLTLSPANNAAQVFQGQPTVMVNASLARTGTTGSVTLTVAGLPQGASDSIQSPGSGNSGSIAFGAGTAAPGTYSLTITASDGAVSGQASLSLTIGAAAVISSATNGAFNLAMSTAFQPAEWDDAFFTLNPSATTTLSKLGPHHIRLQGVSQGVPQGSAGTASQTWDFSVLDAITQPVLGVGDHSPEFQIAKAPPYMYVNNDSSQSFLSTTDFSAFATYAQNLVKYYNTAQGFTAGGSTYVSPGYSNGDTITYWGIYNEPSINNNLNATEYTTMYNTLVPAMQTIDPSLKFVAMELCCSSEDWLQTFAPKVTAQVDVVATHYYASCNQKDTDTMLMDAVPGFVSSVQTIYSNLSTNPVLTSVPVWVTENNVNADYDAGNNMSACNPGQPFVTDLRGSSAFFAGWRPYVFSQLGKAGVKALYHWDFGADKQFGEVDYNTDTLQLSYWVDYWLGQIFPTTASSQLLNYTATDDAELETLPVVNGDGSVVIMVSNHAVNNPSADNNGPGAPRSVLVDVSALGTFSSGSLMIIDTNTSVASGPTASSVTPAPQMTISLGGYGVAFLTLKP